MTEELNWAQKAILQHPCWFCEEIGTLKDSFFSIEWDTPFHLKCVFKRLSENPHDIEARMMAIEYLCG